jgi:hypothetical protein
MYRLFIRRGRRALSYGRVRRAIAVTPFLLAPLTFAMGLMPSQAWACACGCGVFDVGTSSMFPTGSGGTAFLGYDYQDQDHNWHGSSSAPAANNSDKELETHFFTAGLQYMFDRSWGFQVEVPLWDRKFTTDTSFGSPPPDIVTTQWAALGDIRIRGIYTGFSEDLSTGVTYGFKLPSGDFTFNPSVVDRDSQIGSGSTDILLGAFHRGALTDDNMWSWFAQIQFDQPVFTQDQYRPGTEIDTAVGAHYNGWSVGDLKITPVAQIIASVRTRDSGAAAAIPLASGYQRLMLSPGFEFDLNQISFYADAEVPVYQHFTGNQLAAPVLLKVFVAYNF